MGRDLISPRAYCSLPAPVPLCSTEGMRIQGPRAGIRAYRAEGLIKRSKLRSCFNPMAADAPATTRGNCKMTWTRAVALWYPVWCLVARPLEGSGTLYLILRSICTAARKCPSSDTAISPFAGTCNGCGPSLSLTAWYTPLGSVHNFILPNGPKKKKLQAICQQSQRRAQRRGSQGSRVTSSKTAMAIGERPFPCSKQVWRWPTWICRLAKVGLLFLGLWLAAFWAAAPVLELAAYQRSLVPGSTCRYCIFSTRLRLVEFWPEEEDHERHRTAD